MSVAHPVARSLFSRRLACPSLPGAVAAAAVAPLTASPLCRSFHASPQLETRRKAGKRAPKADAPKKQPKLPKLKLGKNPTQQRIGEYTKSRFPQYTPEELAELRNIYTPEQIESVMAGEAAINPEDLTLQARLRKDPYRFNYLDDFSTIQPIIDKRPKRQPPPDPMARFMNLDEFTRDLIEWADKFKVGEKTGTLKKLEDFAPEALRGKPEPQWPTKARTEVHEKYMAYLQEEAAKSKNGDVDGTGEDNWGPTDADVLSYILQRSSMTDNGLISNSDMAPGLANKVPGVEGMYKNPVDPEDGGLDADGTFQNLKLQTGMTVKQILDLRTKVISLRSVSNQTRMGKIRGTSASVIAGNGDGWIGIGHAYSVEPMDAHQKALLKAIANMKPILRYEDRTVYGNLECKISGTVVRLFNRPPGFGLRVPHNMYFIAHAAGLQDLAARIPRSRSPLNTAKAAVQALQTQRSPEEIAMGRGKKLIDVRRVYYGGQV
ncbi:hypothetical protein B0T16DRAFT_323554 [Cercophora newfieldiana]|uniref:Small ribosomal subunit protein uS5m n=1 Tax=Cercophora newfieldiana TaxID=92897 RepID=A0AA39YF04_9PEZI|nr:hypothetical protein B0T16DRAFT_323554 [Cercophora newfieldiana]